MAIEAVTPASGNYARNTAGGSSSPSSRAGTGDSTQQQAERRGRKPRLRQADAPARQIDSAPPEPGKGEAIDTKA
jgi:hypothetical protein